MDLNCLLKILVQMFKLSLPPPLSHAILTSNLDSEQLIDKMDFFRGRYSLSVAIGAIFGALSRFYITELIQNICGQEWGFLGTFFVNVSGCLIIAYIFTIVRENIRIIAPELGLMLATGFCGSYTTFSAYSLEVNNFLGRGDLTSSLIYWLGTVIGGMIAVKMGVILARTGFPR